MLDDKLDCKDLKKAGLKVTLPRVKILNILENTKQRHISAEEVYKGISAKYPHKDELWIWIPPDEQAVGLLKNFLDSFQTSPGLKNNQMEVEFLGDNAKELALIFKESFLPIPQTVTKANLPIAVLRYKAGTLNSRKAMVTPFLPENR